MSKRLRNRAAKSRKVMWDKVNKALKNCGAIKGAVMIQPITTNGSYARIRTARAKGENKPVARSDRWLTGSYNSPTKIAKNAKKRLSDGRIVNYYKGV